MNGTGQECRREQTEKQDRGGIMNDKGQMHFYFRVFRIRHEIVGK